MVFPSVDTVVVVPPKRKLYAMQLAVENMAQWQVVALCHRIPVACSHAASWDDEEDFPPSTVLEDPGASESGDAS